MDPKQTNIDWLRLVESGLFSLRNYLVIARGYSVLVHRVEANSEAHAKCMRETQRCFKQLDDTITRLFKLVRCSEAPVPARQVAAVELLPLIREVVASLPVGDSDSPFQVRTEDVGQTVLANQEDLTLLIDRTSRWVGAEVQPDVPTVWVREPSVDSLAEYRIIIAAPDQLESASDPDNLVPFTDDRAPFHYALDIAVAFRQLVANGGRMFCFREKKPGAVIVLPRA
jgi:hypothetical protein